MTTLSPGYTRPAVRRPLSQDAERAIAQTCPGATVASWPTEGHVHPYWGPFQAALTGHAMDEEVRFAGSSGGVISALLIYALESGLIDRVLHVGADPERPTHNLTVVSRSRASILQNSGSRYTASSPLTSIEAALTEGGSMAVVGKPCDLSALRQLAKIDERVEAHVPLMLSFFCGGMPSHNGVLRILDKMGVAKDEVAEFRFRGMGWPGTAAARTRDGRVAEMSYEESWGGFLSKEVQFRCKICPDAVGGVADIACADAWYGGESGYPKFDERDGRSLILSRSHRGARFLEAAQAAGAVTTEDLDVGQIDLMQPSQARRKRLVAARVAATRLLAQPTPKMTGTKVGAAARRAGVLEMLRNFAGTARRIASGRR